MLVSTFESTLVTCRNMFLFVGFDQKQETISGDPYMSPLMMLNSGYSIMSSLMPLHMIIFYFLFYLFIFYLLKKEKTN
jgi:Ca2+/Na+ antiporter